VEVETFSVRIPEGVFNAVFVPPVALVFVDPISIAFLRVCQRPQQIADKTNLLPALVHLDPRGTGGTPWQETEQLGAQLLDLGVPPVILGFIIGISHW
jgi:hypothetical protein